MPSFQREQRERPVLNGRPYHNAGLPVGLFHPVFNAFHAAMRSPERFHADAKTYSSVRCLFGAFSDIYPAEDKRTDAIDEHLKILLGDSFVVVEAPTVKCDGVIIQKCGDSVAYLAAREIKNEIGSAGSDPYSQGGLSYRKYWAGAARKSDQFAFIIALLICIY
jgi:hypothetical protein